MVTLQESKNVFVIEIKVRAKSHVHRVLILHEHSLLGLRSEALLLVEIDFEFLEHEILDLLDVLSLVVGPVVPSFVEPSSLEPLLLSLLDASHNQISSYIGCQIHNWFTYVCQQSGKLAQEAGCGRRHGRK